MSSKVFRYCCAALTLAAIIARLLTPLLPACDPDTEGYLGPALSFITGHGFIHINSRAFPYPLFLTVILCITHTLKAIVIIQHILGIASVLLLWVCFNRMVKFFRIKNIIVFYFGFVLLLNYTVSTGVIEAEKTIRPEGVFPFLFSAFLYLLILFFEQRDKTVFNYYKLVFFNALLYFVFPRWGFALPFVWLLVTFIFYRLSSNATTFIVHICGSASIVFLLLFLPENFLIPDRETDSGLFLQRQLIYTHAEIIGKYLHEADNSAGRLTLIDKSTLQQLIVVFDTSLNAAKMPYSILGIDPDALMYGPAFDKVDSLIIHQPAFISAKMNKWAKTKTAAEKAERERMDVLDVKKYFSNSYNELLIKSLLAKPGKYFHKVVLQISAYYKLAGECSFYYSPYFDINRFQLNELKRLCLFNGTNYLMLQPVKLSPYSGFYFIESANNFFCRIMQLLFLPLVLLGCGLCVLLSASMRKIILTGNVLLFLLVLTVACIHTFDNQRYLGSIHTVALTVFFINGSVLIILVSNFLKQLKKVT